MSITYEYDTLTVSKDTKSERIDKFLNTLYPNRTRSYLQFLIRESYIFVNGKKVKKRELIKEGDLITITFVSPPEVKLEAEPLDLDILFEDEDIVVVNKAPGIVVHPATGNWSGTLINGLLHHCVSIENPGDNLRPGIVHRLDKDTSGVIVVAKTYQAQKKLVEMFSQRTVKKCYLAICVGHPGNVALKGAIERHPVHRKKMCISETGRSAHTTCTTLSHSEKLSLVKLDLKTGRTHQIRVHMEKNKTPILGDIVYGAKQANKRFGVERQLLHALSLTFKHPVNGEEMSFEAPLPGDMQKIIKQEKLKADQKSYSLL